MAITSTVCILAVGNLLGAVIKVPYASRPCNRATAGAWYNFTQPQFPAGRDWIRVCYHSAVRMGVSSSSRLASRCVVQAKGAQPCTPSHHTAQYLMPPGRAGTLQQAVLSECVTGWVLALPLLFVTRAHRTWDWRLVLSLGTFEVGCWCHQPSAWGVRAASPAARTVAAELDLYSRPIAGAVLWYAWCLHAAGNHKCFED
jgi:hypothetical protein